MSRPRKQLRCLTFAAVLSAALAACSDAPSAPAHRDPGAPQLAIRDGANGGTAGFYWLAPLVKDPVTRGTFDPGLHPVVQVCEMTATGCGAVVAEFSRERGTGNETVKVDHAGQRYFVNWNTRQCGTGACALDPAKTYRVRVLLGGLEAGYADVDVVSTQAQMKNVNTGEFVALVDGKVLQVRFRLEEGIALRGPVSAATRERFRPLVERYRDWGIRPSTGRSGDAHLVVRALLNRDGTTDVEASSGTALNPPRLDPRTGSGRMDHVQLKALRSDGDALWTRNFTDLPAGEMFHQRVPAGGLARHAPFQLQVNVSELGESRTVVVTAQGVVGRRPDPAVEGLQLPERVRVGQQVMITADIRERNGDVGARMRCVLYVDGVKADEIGTAEEPLWVDGGDVVTCALTTSFATTGPKSIRVALEGVAPADDDWSSNDAMGQIAVTNGSDFLYTASARDFAYERSGPTTSWTEGRRMPGDVLDYRYENDGSEQVNDRGQSHYMSGYMPTGVTLPLVQARLTASSDGVTLQDVTMTDFVNSWFNSGATPDGELTWSSECWWGSGLSSGGQNFLSVCSSRTTVRSTGQTWSSTDFWHDRWASRATYFSGGTYRFFFGGGMSTGTWQSNWESQIGDHPQPAVGSTYAISLTFVERPAGGTETRTYTAATEPHITLSGWQTEWINDRTEATGTPACFTSRYDPTPEYYYLTSFCDKTLSVMRSRFGIVTTFPGMTP